MAACADLLKQATLHLGYSHPHSGETLWTLELRGSLGNLVLYRPAIHVSLSEGMACQMSCALDHLVLAGTVPGRCFDAYTTPNDTSECSGPSGLIRYLSLLRIMRRTELLAVNLGLRQASGNWSRVECCLTGGACFLPPQLAFVLMLCLFGLAQISFFAGVLTPAKLCRPHVCALLSRGLGWGNQGNLSLLRKLPTSALCFGAQV